MLAQQPKSLIDAFSESFTWNHRESVFSIFDPIDDEDDKEEFLSAIRCILSEQGFSVLATAKTGKRILFFSDKATIEVTVDFSKTYTSVSIFLTDGVLIWNPLTTLHYDFGLIGTWQGSRQVSKILPKLVYSS